MSATQSNKPERQLLHPAENIQRFEARQALALDRMVRVRVLTRSTVDYLKARHGDDADEDLLAMLEMAWESAMDAIEAVPPLSVLTTDEGGEA